MSIRAWPLTFLTLRGSDFEFCCFRLCRSTQNIPVKPSYRRAMSTLLPSVNVHTDPFDEPPKITNSLAYMDSTSTPAAAPVNPSRPETSSRQWRDR